MNDFLNTIASDCAILLRRAFEGKDIVCFGIDGFGLHGTSDRAVTYPIAAVAIQLDVDNDLIFPSCKLRITLDNYDSTDHGHILTDMNFKHSLNTLLQAQDIDLSCWTWGTELEQEQDTVVLNLDVEKLLA
jgi:hypothetical protein